MTKHDNLSNFVGESWLTPLSGAFDYFKEKIIPYLKAEKERLEICNLESPESKKQTIYPSTLANVFRAFKETPYNTVRVVIIGQDPYHDGSATGIAFDNSKTKRPSPSLRNILKEIVKDCGETQATENVLSYLEHLPSQGVLFLNTALTVVSKEPLSHVPIWAPFTEEVIKVLNKRDQIVWVLWGTKAHAFEPKINPRHVIVKGAHPSPFSYHLFKDKRFFEIINSSLKNKIRW